VYVTGVVVGAVTFLMLSGPGFRYHRLAWRNSFHLAGSVLVSDRLVSRRPIAWTQTEEVVFSYLVWKDVQNRGDNFSAWKCELQRHLRLQISSVYNLKTKILIFNFFFVLGIHEKIKCTDPPKRLNFDFPYLIWLNIQVVKIQKHSRRVNHYTYHTI
jgi:hypothetical protein